MCCIPSKKWWTSSLFKLSSNFFKPPAPPKHVYIKKKHNNSGDLVPIRRIKNFLFGRQKTNKISNQKRNQEHIECPAAGTEWTEPKRTPEEIRRLAKKMKQNPKK